jgi:hypothetical protein
MEPTSRLRFGKIHSIEWNVKVREIGVVSRKHMSKLLAYHQEEEGKGFDDDEDDAEPDTTEPTKHSSGVVPGYTENEIGKDFEENRGYLLRLISDPTLSETGDYTHTGYSSMKPTRPSHIYQEPHRPDQYDDFEPNNQENRLAKPSMTKTVKSKTR